MLQPAPLFDSFAKSIDVRGRCSEETMHSRNGERGRKGPKLRELMGPDAAEKHSI